MGHAPENTLLSIKAALGMGVHGVEVDVHLSEGRLVVIHDETVDRTTNGSGRLEEFSLDELRRLDAGKGEKIPFLEEVIGMVGQEYLVNVELKGARTGCAVARVLLEHVDEKGWNPGQFLVSSFNESELLDFRERAPGFRIGVLATEASVEESLGKAIQLNAFSVNLSVRAVKPQLVQEAGDAGLVVLVYTVNSPEIANELENMGVNGVFSDVPDRIIDRGRTAE